MIKIGEAVYLDGTSIQSSMQDDWGWFFAINLDNDGKNDNDSENGKNNEKDVAKKYFVLKVYKNGIMDKIKNKIKNEIRDEWEAEIINPKSANEVEVTMGSSASDDEPIVTRVTIEQGSVKEINACLYSFSASVEYKKGKTSHKVRFPFNQKHRISLSYYTDYICGNNNVIVTKARLIPDSGYYPSHFFFMLGATSNGKSCWLYALNTRKVRAKAMIQYKNSSGLKLVYFGNNQSANVDTIDATQVDEIKFYSCQINKNKDEENKDKDKEVVFIVDLAGEISNLSNDDPKIDNIVLRICSYASGVFVVRNHKWLLDGEIKDSDPNENIYKNLMGGTNPISQNKVCYILTGTDIIKEEINKDPAKGEPHYITPDSPIFSQAETKDQMYLRMALTSDIMKRLEPLVGDSPCFPVSSCSPQKDENGNPMKNEKNKELLTFKESCNVELPFIYMLEQV